MKNFSAVHRLHRFVRLEYGLALARIFHLVVKRCFLLLSGQMYVLSSVILAGFVVERHLVVSKPSFKFCSSKTYIGLSFAGSHHLGLVNDSFREAVSF